MSSIYSSEDWKRIPPHQRDELLLVLEGVKPGVITSGDWGPFQHIVEQAGLVYLPTTRKYEIRLVARVSRPEVLDEHLGELLQVPQRAKGAAYHRINGRFLGYPSCCVEEYSRKRTPEEAKARRAKNHLHTYTFGRELEALIKKEGKYPDVFDYRTPSFTPCSVSCQNAIATLTQWKEALEKYDPEAAETLVAFNRQEEPERSVHKEFWKEYAKKHEPERLESLRRWLRGENNHWFSQRRQRRKVF